MFNTTHDAILLIIALLYLFVGIARAIMANPRSDYPPGWFGFPFLVSAVLAITAVLW